MRYSRRAPPRASGCVALPEQGPSNERASHVPRRRAPLRARLPAALQRGLLQPRHRGRGRCGVDRIIESSRRRNPEQGITGMLVFGSGIFFQWLEGPRDNVTQLMAVLRADPRHENVVQLSEIEEVRERLFPDWDMEARDERPHPRRAARCAECGR
ncbi:MAG: BLUF domain-containing protein [Comamonadaceae bacterium]|nr:BLUF domain-containing protein [Comamonadaceae bacterium]